MSWAILNKYCILAILEKSNIGVSFNIDIRNSMTSVVLASFWYFLQYWTVRNGYWNIAIEDILFYIDAQLRLVPAYSHSFFSLNDFSSFLSTPTVTRFNRVEWTSNWFKNKYWPMATELHPYTLYHRNVNLTIDTYKIVTLGSPRGRISLKGSVSRKLRPRLLYIFGKLSL